ncbi:MAG: hypothetical protein MJ033_07260 [Victivallaceae bacterium]|nr:hypothetical protein [Victivallaceae bacterium]
MLKLNASYSKKVPAEGEYSSQSYHASVEVELPDGLTSSQLNEKIHDTFDLVRKSVESELSKGQPTSESREKPVAERSHGNAQSAEPASPKQLKYLLFLAGQKGVTPQQIAAKFNVTDIQQLTKKQCSEMIESWKEA